MKYPLVSIVIPCYNYAHFLTEAVESVLAQSYPHKEIIVINDGSTDNTDEVAKKFGDKITYISQKNQGPVKTFNRGVRASKGEYVAVFSADDVLDKEFISKLIEPFLHSSDPKLAFTYCDYVMYNGERKLFKSRPWNALAELYRNYVVATALTRRSAFDDIGGYSEYMNAKVSFEDWDFWIKMIGKGYRGHYVPGVYLYYRIHGQGRNVEGAKRAGEIIREVIAHNRDVYDRIDYKFYHLWRHSIERIKNKIRTKILGLESTYPV